MLHFRSTIENIWKILLYVKNDLPQDLYNNFANFPIPNIDQKI